MWCSAVRKENSSVSEEAAVFIFTVDSRHFEDAKSETRGIGRVSGVLHHTLIKYSPLILFTGNPIKHSLRAAMFHKNSLSKLMKTRRVSKLIVRLVFYVFFKTIIPESVL
jgi:hypothetical protein